MTCSEAHVGPGARTEAQKGWHRGEGTHGCAQGEGVWMGCDLRVRQVKLQDKAKGLIMYHVGTAYDFKQMLFIKAQIKPIFPVPFTKNKNTLCEAAGGSSGRNGKEKGAGDTPLGVMGEYALKTSRRFYFFWFIF